MVTDGNQTCDGDHPRRTQISNIYAVHLKLTQREKKTFKDNFAITFYPPKLFEYLSYPNESWKS